MRSARSSPAAAALFPTTRQSCPWLPLVRTRISSARLECGTTGSVPLEDTVLSEFSVIEGKYLRDILNQPQALEDTLAGLEELKKSRELAARLEKGTFKTVVLTGMMALKWLGDVLSGRDLRRTREELKQAAPAVQPYLADLKNHVQSLAQLLKGIRHLFLVGRGSSLAAVGTGALIVKESDRFHAEGMSSAAFRHGPFEMLSEETFVLVFSGDSRTRDLNLRLLDDIREQQGRTELVSEDAAFAPCSLPAAPRCIQPILEILPVQMITLALAAQAGREPGRFELATKVIITE